MQSFSTKSFYSVQMTEQKKFALTCFAYYVSWVRNNVSKYFYDNFLLCSLIEKSKDFTTHIRHLNDETLNINSCFDHILYEEVFNAYNNKAKQVNKLTGFESVRFIDFNYYKRTTKNYNKGDFKSVNIEKKTTPLSMTLTYFAKYVYDKEGIEDYIKEQYEVRLPNKLSSETNEQEKEKLNSRITYYKTIYDCIQRFKTNGRYDRLIKLAFDKRDRIVKKYKKLIEFEAINFSGVSRKTKLLDFNKTETSSIRSFISLSGIDLYEIKLESLPNKFQEKFKELLISLDKQLEEKQNRDIKKGYKSRKSDYLYDSFCIPVNYMNNRYFGNLKDYIKSINWYEYTVVFENGKIKVNFAKSCERYLPEVTSEDEVCGIDVNVKHNMMTLSDGTTYDYDRELLDEYIKTLLHIDKLKKEHAKYNKRLESEGKEKVKFNLGKKLTKKKKAIEKNIENNEKQLISDMLKHLKETGVRHIAMEDLCGGFGKCHVKTQDDLNYNRLVSAVKLSSIKDLVKSIAVKYDIAVSFV